MELRTGRMYLEEKESKVVSTKLRLVGGPHMAAVYADGKGCIFSGTRKMAENRFDELNSFYLRAARECAEND